MEELSLELHKNGDKVMKTGIYQCISCGNQVLFNEGEFFTECDVCLSGSENGPAGFGLGVEFWKFIE